MRFVDRDKNVVGTEVMDQVLEGRRVGGQNLLAVVQIGGDEDLERLLWLRNGGGRGVDECSHVVSGDGVARGKDRTEEGPFHNSKEPEDSK